MIISNTVLLLKSQFSEDEPDKYELLLKSENFEVRQIKTLEFKFKNLEELRTNLCKSAEFSGLILSSPRCVQAVQMTTANSDCLKEWKAKSNFVVGEATYKAAVGKLGLDCLGKESGNAGNLSKVILDKKSQYSKPFLFPHGNLKSDTLNLELQKEGLEIDEIEVYDTIANPHIDSDLSEVTNGYQSIPEYIVFFSPSGLSASLPYLQKVPVKLDQVKFVAIGPVTEMAIVESDLPVFGVAQRPNPVELLKVLKRL